MATTSLTGFYSDPATKAINEPAPKLTTDDQLQSARQSLTEAGKSKGMLQQAQAGEKAEQTKMLAEADVQGREAFKKAIETDPFRAEYREKVKEQADTKFVPTQETAGDLGLLFTLTNILGFAIGGKSKGNAQAAMSAMNGMLEGHQKGRQDIYKQEKDKFDENFKALDKTIQSLKTQYEDAMKTYANDREEGMAKARMAVAEHNARFIQDSLEKFGPAYAYDQIRDTVSMLEKAKAAEQKLQDAEERRRETERTHQETRRHNLFEEGLQQRRLAEAPLRRDEKALQAIGPALRGIAEDYPEGTAQRLVGASTDDKKRIMGSYRAIQESEQVADYIARNPDAVGALAAIRNIVKMDAIKSIQNPDETQAANQKAALVEQGIEKPVQSKTISADAAEKAKVLSKRLFSLALSDAQSAGQRGSVYLDRQFQNFYDQASRPKTLLTVVRERTDENNRNLRPYLLNIERSSVPEKFPFSEAKSIDDYIKERSPQSTVPDKVQKALGGLSDGHKAEFGGKTYIINGGVISEVGGK